MNEVEALSSLIYDARAVCTLCASSGERPKLTSHWPRGYRYSGRPDQQAFTLLSSTSMIPVAASTADLLQITESRRCHAEYALEYCNTGRVSSVKVRTEAPLKTRDG
jgi:hypothetical protein